MLRSSPSQGFHAYALGNYSFSVVRVANAMGAGCEPRNVYAALRRLEARGELETLLDTGVRGKGFGVKLNKKGVEVFRSGRMEEVADKLVERMEAKEGKAEGKVKEVWSIMYRMYKLNAGDKDSRVRLFKHTVRGYFEGILVDAESEKSLSAVNVPDVCKTSMVDADLRRCASDVSRLRHDSRLSAESFVAGALIPDSSPDYGARAVANLLHGIDLPRQSMVRSSEERSDEALRMFTGHDDNIMNNDALWTPPLATISNARSTSLVAEPVVERLVLGKLEGLRLRARPQALSGGLRCIKNKLSCVSLCAKQLPLIK